MKNIGILLALLVLNLAVPTVWCQETVTVKKGDLNLEVNIPGVFIADDKDEIKMEPRQYSGDLIVTRIISEGASVKPGDVLIEFDSAKLEEAIEEARNEATDAEVGLKKANAEFQSAVIENRSQGIQLQAELEMLQQELDAARSKQSLDIQEKRKAIVDAGRDLQKLNEDLKMLRDIYNERSLATSTSGDILLERQLISIDNAKKDIEFRQRQLDYFEKFDLNKEQLQKQLEIEKKQAERDKQRIMLAAEVSEKQSVVTKAMREMDAANEKVQELNDDREKLKVFSPREGIVFYGETDQEVPAGIIISASGMRSVRDELRVGGRVRTHKILLTIATMKHLSIKMNVLENDIQLLKNGLPITVFPDAFPADSFAGKLTSVDQIATKVSFFANAEKRFRVMGKCTELAPLLRSGMNGRVTIHAEAVKNAIVIPVSAVFERGDSFYCYLKTDSGHETRDVEIGMSNATEVQITTGLQEGDVVYLKDPNDKNRDD